METIAAVARVPNGPFRIETVTVGPPGASFSMLTGGQAVAGEAMFEVLNPATEQVVAQAPDATRADLDRAVAAARAAFPGWAATPIEERRRVLNAMGDAVLANVDALKRLLTSEQGKPHAEAEGEIIGAGYWLKGAASLQLPVTVNEDSAERHSETRHVPIGVVGAIAPWNFPRILAMFKVGPALLAGNTMVLKPSPFMPLTPLKFGELVAGLLPPGVLNIGTGGDALGPWITEHPDIDKVSFIGATATGKRVNNAPQYHRVLELIADAKAQGCKFLTGGEHADVPGYFVPIAILDNPPEARRIVQEEQFGPILPLLKFDDVDEAIARANATDYGLGGSVGGRDEDKALEIAQRIASGTVWVNETQHLSPLAAFGGHKQSGAGAEGGVEGLLEYTNTQTIVRRKKPA